MFLVNRLLDCFILLSSMYNDSCQAIFSEPLICQHGSHDQPAVQSWGVFRRRACGCWHQSQVSSDRKHVTREEENHPGKIFSLKTKFQPKILFFFVFFAKNNFTLNPAPPCYRNTLSQVGYKKFSMGRLSKFFFYNWYSLLIFKSKF